MDTNPKRRHVIIFLSVLLLAAAIIWLLCYYLIPQPVFRADELENWTVGGILAAGGPYTEAGEIDTLTEFDSEALLAYLADCSMTRKLTSADVRFGSDGMLIQLALIGPDDTALLYCSERECTASFAEGSYTLKNAKEVTQDLMSIIYK